MTIYSGNITPNKPDSYTKEEAEELFVSKTTQINGKPLNSDITITSSDVGALPSDTVIPTVPTNISSFNNDAGYLTQHQDISGKQDVLTAGNNIDITSNVISAVVPSTTPRFSINNGNKNNQGTADILSYSGSTLSFKVDDGTNYAPLSATTGYSGEQLEKTSLSTVDVSSLANGTYNVFVPKTGTQPYLLANTIFVQAEKPADTPTDTIPQMTSNTSPYGTVTTTTTNQPNSAFYLFRQGEISDVYWGGVTYYACIGRDTPSNRTFTYTYDENYQPLAGTYQVKYTKHSSDPAQVNKISVTLTDNTSVQIWSGYTYDSLQQTFTVSSPIKSITLTASGSINDNKNLGSLQLLKPAITAEGTLWVNNGVEPLEVQARDNNAQWQAFNDILCGTVTVASGAITAVTQPQFNKFSTVNMHNISTVAHEDIRDKIDTINTTLISVNRTGTTSYQGLTKLYDSTGSATDGTMTQNAITTALGNKQDALTGLTASVTELNYCAGVTSNIQEQLNALSQRIAAIE